ncbi:rhoptry kinase family protein ROP30 [Toxoplasma gondii ARI]|uniref:Rhoptry kinase family protein ROP30 n=1 Tax=Toxoplasma gondii ARI TaxID=1074872 RepID=A0A139XX50_TOXGO|nr:rhoptry kinase family protein ROP30 [Toxoplasma gondii ARI]
MRDSSRFGRTVFSRIFNVIAHFENMSFFSLLHLHSHQSVENATPSTSPVAEPNANAKDHPPRAGDTGYLLPKPDSGKSSSTHSGWCLSPHRDARDHIFSHSCISSAASVKIPRRTKSTNPVDPNSNPSPSTPPPEGLCAKRSHSEGGRAAARSKAHGWGHRERHASRRHTTQHLNPVKAGQPGAYGADGGTHEKNMREKGEESAPQCRPSRWHLGESQREHSLASVFHSVMVAMKSLPATFQREWSLVRKIYRQSGRVKHAQRLERAREAKLQKFGLSRRASSRKPLPSLVSMQQVVPTAECASALIKEVRRNLEKSMRDFQHASPALSFRRERLFPPGREFVVRSLARNPPFTTMALVAGRLLGGGSEAMVFAAEEIELPEKRDVFIGADDASRETSGEYLPRLLAIKIYLCEANLLDQPVKAAEEAEAVEWLQMAFWRLVPSCVDVLLSRQLGVAAPSWRYEWRTEST